MAESTAKPSYSMDPILYLYTSLTAGSSHIITATSRMETILRANKIPFKGVDLATDEKARMLWGRRSGKDESGRVRKLPGLVQMGMVVGDIVEVEDWNEYGELKLHVKIVPLDGSPAPKPAAAKAGPSTAAAPKTNNENAKPATISTPLSAKETLTKSTGPPEAGNTVTLAMRSIGEEAAKKAKDLKKGVTKVLEGKGEASAPAPADASKSLKQSAVIPPPVLTTTPPGLDTTTSPSDTTLTAMQSPTTSSWSRTPTTMGIPTTPPPSKAPAPISTEESSDVLASASMQSPRSGAWKPMTSYLPTDVDKPVTMHRGSSISQASKEEIKAIEDEQMIKEESDEDDDEEEAVID